MRELRYYRGVPVPYVTTWDHEYRAAKNSSGLRLQMRRIDLPDAPLTVRYEDETPHDRDENGALWQRYPLAPGKGHPHFAKIHPARQRRAMTRHLCQVCGNPADRDERGWLWLVTRQDAERLAHGGEPAVRTANPPVCQRCCDLARELCPHLLRGNAVIRAPRVRPWGVYGICVELAGGSPNCTVSYDAPDIHRTIAGQMLVRLEGVTLIDLALTA